MGQTAVNDMTAKYYNCGHIISDRKNANAANTFWTATVSTTDPIWVPTAFQCATAGNPVVVACVCRGSGGPCGLAPFLMHSYVQTSMADITYDRRIRRPKSIFRSIASVTSKGDDRCKPYRLVRFIIMRSCCCGSQSCSKLSPLELGQNELLLIKKA